MKIFNFHAKTKFTELAGGDNHQPSADNTWEDWDLSALIPANAVAVLVVHACMDPGFGDTRQWGCRKNGSALIRNKNYSNSKNPGTYGSNSLVCEVDANKVIEVWGAITQSYFGIAGYWN